MIIVYSFKVVWVFLCAFSKFIWSYVFLFQLFYCLFSAPLFLSVSVTLLIFSPICTHTVVTKIFVHSWISFFPSFLLSFVLSFMSHIFVATCIFFLFKMLFVGVLFLSSSRPWIILNRVTLLKHKTVHSCGMPYVISLYSHIFVWKRAVFRKMILSYQNSRIEGALCFDNCILSWFYIYIVERTFIYHIEHRVNLYII